MIASIFGTITHIQETKITVQQSGIGFDILCPTAQQLTLNQSINLFIHMHWSAENGPSLFGFTTALQKDLFLLIIDCQGIGPKLGVSILEQVEPDQLLHFVAQENTAALNKIKGLGAKKVELLCLHLKDKASKIIKMHPAITANSALGDWHDLAQTLTSLNYSTSEIKQVTSIIKEETVGQTVPFDLLLRKALTILAKK